MTEDGAQKYTPEELAKLWSEFMIDGARYGDSADVREALQNNAHVDYQDSSGRTALHMAAANGYVDIAESLLKAGANTEAKNEIGSTPLHWACVSGSVPMVQLLLHHGANPAVVNRDGQVPIDGALDNEAVCQLFQDLQSAPATPHKQESTANASCDSAAVQSKLETHDETDAIAADLGQVELSDAV